MPQAKPKNRVGKLAQKLRQIKAKPRQEEDEADLIEFYDDDYQDKPQTNEQNTTKESRETSAARESDIIEIAEPKTNFNKPSEDKLRIAQIQDKLKKTDKEVKMLPREKISAKDIAKMVKEAIKEQLSEELKQRDTSKEQRKLEKQKRQDELELIREEKEAERERKREERLAKLEKERLEQERLALEKLRVSLETGIKEREHNLAQALNISIRKARNSALLS